MSDDQARASPDALGTLLHELLERDPTRAAVERPEGNVVSYGALAARAREIAAWVRGEGAARVAFALRDPADQLAATLGTLLAGATAVPLDPRAPATVRDARALRAGARFRWWTELPRGGDDESRPCVDAREGDDAIVLFTSGSTGAAKGVVLQRRSVAWNVAAIAAYLPIAGATHTALVLPLGYSYALVGQALVTLRAGGVIHALSGLVPPEQIRTMRAIDGLVGLSSVAIGLRLLAEAALGSDGPLSSVAYVGCAGGPLDAPTLSLVRAAFPCAAVWSQYGLTEAGPRVAAIRSDDPAFAVGIAGRPLPGAELRVGDDGEILVRSPGVMRGYLDDPEATSEVLSADSWLRTRDAGELDASSGLVRVLGRIDGVVKVAGERVSVEEVESALSACAGIADCAVAALPDDRLGARLVALVVGERQAIRAARRTLLETLASAQRPLAVHAVERIPRTESGKLDRVEVRRFAERLETRDGRW